jgi:hypothetical protein
LSFVLRLLQVVGICRAKPLKLDPLEVLGEGGKGVGPALRQLQKMQVRFAAAAVHVLPAGGRCLLHFACLSSVTLALHHESCLSSEVAGLLAPNVTVLPARGGGCCQAGRP